MLGTDKGLQIDIFGNTHEYESKPLEQPQQLTLDQALKDKLNFDKIKEDL